MVGRPADRLLLPRPDARGRPDGPGIDQRGATSAPFPGYMLHRPQTGLRPDADLGRADADRRVRRDAVRPQPHQVRVQRPVPAMQYFDAGTLNGQGERSRSRAPSTDRSSAMPGCTAGWWRCRASARATARTCSTCSSTADLSDGQVHSPQPFFKAAELTPQTFNSFYVDDKHVAEFTSGLLPMRPESVDPSLPTIGTGKGSGAAASPDRPPAGDRPAHTPVGTMTNWNNVAAHGFGAADDTWTPAARRSASTCSTTTWRGCARHGKWSLATLTSAMNASATQDVRAMPHRAGAPEAAPRRPRPRTRQAAKMLSLLVAWRTGRRQPARPQRRRQDRQPRRGDHGRGVAADRRRLDASGARAALEARVQRRS